MVQMNKSKAPSQRQLRVGELVRHALIEVLSRENFNDPVLDKQLVSVSEVRMSPDLRIATCFIAPLSGRPQKGKEPVKANAVCKALASHAKLIRARTTPHLKQLRYMPSFRFLEDTSFDNFARIDKLLRSESVRQDLSRED